MHDSVAMAWLGLGLIVAVSIAAALLLRWARCPGWAIAGGVCAGIVLGPTIMGRVLPLMHAQLYVGGQAAQRDLNAARRFQELAMVSGETEPLDPLSITALEQQRDMQRWTHQQPMRWGAAIAAGLVLLGASAGHRPWRGAPTPWVSMVTIGGWAALLPGGIAFVVLHMLLGVGLGPALLAAAGVAIGPWRLTPGDVDAAEQAEVDGARLLHGTAMVASAIALLMLSIAVMLMDDAAGGTAMLVMGVLVVGWFVRSAGRWSQSLLHVVLLPTLGGLGANTVDLYADVSIWPLLLVVALSGDGRWLGAYTGAMLLGGRRSLRTMRLVIGVMACGPTQLAVATLAGQWRLLDGSLVMALVAGALLVEVLTPARRAMAQRLAATEAELDELRGG